MDSDADSDSNSNADSSNYNVTWQYRDTSTGTWTDIPNSVPWHWYNGRLVVDWPDESEQMGKHRNVSFCTVVYSNSRVRMRTRTAVEAEVQMAGV